MENSIKVSVVIPVYNVEQYLPKCLTSIVQQTLKDIEIICVNDGSTDNCLKIIEEFKSKDERIKIINKENDGLGSARNAGLEYATGEYISFIDSDDYVDENFLELLYNEAKENDADVACCGVIREGVGVNEVNGQKIQLKFEEVKVSDNPDDNLKVSKSLPYPYPWNKVYKRDFLISYGIKYEENIYYEDLIFTPFVITKAEKLISVPDVFYHYVEREGSVTSTINDDKKSDKQKAYLMGKKYYLDAKINI